MRSFTYYYRELPRCSITTDRNLPLTKNYKEDKFKCDVYTPEGKDDKRQSSFLYLILFSGEPVSQFNFFKKKSIDETTPPTVGPSNPLTQDPEEEESSKL